MMEQYFKKYSSEIEALEKEPLTTEEQFLSSLSARTRVRRTVKVLMSVAAVLAVALVSTALFRSSMLKHLPDPVQICMEEYGESIRPLYEDIKRMETESELCREMGISGTVEELVSSSVSFSGELSGMDRDSRAETMRLYCQRQTECVAELYRDCLAAYMGAVPQGVQQR